MNKPSLAILATLFAIALTGCGGEKSVNEQTLDRLNNTELQLFTSGKQLYTKYCKNCHMEDGKGLGQLIPPLANADYLLKDLNRAARIIKYGQKGPLEVNGKSYNQPMPANPDLTNQEIQMILAYIGNAWGNKATTLSIKEVQTALTAEE